MCLPLYQLNAAVDFFVSSDSAARTDRAQTADDHFSLADGGDAVTIDVNYNKTTTLLAQRNQGSQSGREGWMDGSGAVSYTHLTLPTIYSV